MPLSIRSRFSRAAIAGFLFGAFLSIFDGCVTGPPLLAPPPAHVETLDGFGSLSFRGAESALRGRFSFAVALPDRARVEILDPLGRTRAVLIFGQGSACLVLPSRKAFWTGPGGELMVHFVGFGLNPGELAGLLGGQWSGPGTAAGPEGGGWALEKDRGGRVLAGTRDAFRFEVEEFHGKTSVPRSVRFSREGDSGRLRVLQVRFNRPPRGDAFGLSVLDGLDRKSWPEIEAFLRDEN